MKLILFHDPGFAAPIGPHVMPMRKFALVAKELSRHPQIDIASPTPLTEEDLLRVHTPEYVSAVRLGDPRKLAESQKFPWTPQLFGSVLLTGGGVLAAAREALKTGVSGALASGFHHSCADHGEGFCTFNGLVVALEALKAEGAISTAAIIDLDLHYGNGTASLAETRPWLQAFSLYGNDYADNMPYRDVSERYHEDGENHFSVPLAPSGGPDGDIMMQLLEEHLSWVLRKGTPDILLFQAGADPLKEDPYSPLNLTHEDLKRRDKMVFRFAQSHGIPVAWVLAGGYTPEVEKVVEVHVNTALACLEVYHEPLEC